MDEDSVNITRHKKILEGIRNGDTTDDGRAGVGDRHVESGYDLDRQDEGRTVTSDSGTGERTQGASQSNGIATRPDTGTGQADRPGKPASPRPRNNRRRTQADEVVAEKPTQARFRIPFFDHKPDPKKAVRLFSKEEVDASLEQLTEVYKKVFSAFDEGLEIGVKGHEEVEIWAATDAQAETFARRHLAHARFQEEAARSARALMDAADDIEIIQFLVPRFFKTFIHIREHGGLSFK